MAKERTVITRREAETQAERCFEYHAALAAGIIGVAAVFDRRTFPWVAGSLGAGLGLHALCLFGIPATRESLLRTTASLMEDRRHASRGNEWQNLPEPWHPRPEELAVAAMQRPPSQEL